MPPLLRSVLDYLGQGAPAHVQQLLLVLGPLLALALLLQRLSGYVRNRSAGLFRRRRLRLPHRPRRDDPRAGARVLLRPVPPPDREDATVPPRPRRNTRLRRARLQPPQPLPVRRQLFIGTGPIWFGSALVYLLSVWLLGSRVTAPTARVNAAGDAGGLAGRPGRGRAAGPRGRSGGCSRVCSGRRCWRPGSSGFTPTSCSASAVTSR